jgi:hypothetical protein
MKRLPGWRGRLAATISAHRGRRFSPGKHDCGILAADCVLAITGVDLAEPYRGRYSTLNSANRLLKERGYASIADLVAELFPEISPALAQIGDLMLVDDTIGVCNGETVAVYGEHGVGFLPRSRASRAFEVADEGA